MKNCIERNVDILTREQVQFIRRASRSIVFRYANDCATLEAENKTGAVLSVDCDVQFRIYGKENPPVRNPTKAFAMIHTPDFTPAWVTVAGLLRAGDKLQLNFVGDSNGYARVASFVGDSDMEAFNGLHYDCLDLVIIRGKARLTFRVESQICPNNSARMLQW